MTTRRGIAVRLVDRPKDRAQHDGITHGSPAEAIGDKPDGRTLVA
jgi:hypothetical protein